MLRTLFKSKIHRGTVTFADLDYVGSFTIASDLMEAADILPGEQVSVVDVTNGARIETYAIAGPAGSGILGANGAAAHLIHPGDIVIIITYAQMDDKQAREFVPRVVHVDDKNQIIKLGTDPSEPVPEF